MRIKSAVILAAGNGERMLPLTALTNKALLPIGPKSNIEHQIEALEKESIENIYIVEGADRPISKALKSKISPRVKFIIQPSPNGAAQALLQTEPYIDGPFILLLGDIFFKVHSLKALIHSISDDKASCSIATTVACTPEEVSKNFVVIPLKDQLVKQVIEKPTRNLGLIKGCGIYTFTPEVFLAIQNLKRTKTPDLTESIQALIEDNKKVSFFNVFDYEKNLNSPLDLLVCNLDYLKINDIKNYICPSATLGENCIITNSVISKNVTIDPGVSVVDSLILPNTHVKSHIKNAIQSPNGVIAYE